LSRNNRGNFRPLCAVLAIHFDQLPAIGGEDFYCHIYATLICNYTQALTIGEDNLKSMSFASRQLALYGLAHFQCRKGLLPDTGLPPADRDWPYQSDWQKAKSDPKARMSEVEVESIRGSHDSSSS
jgi:hypothetical protein